MKISKVSLASLTVLAAAVVAESVIASGIATIQGDNASDSTIQLEYLDNNRVRMNVADKDRRNSYMLLLNGKTYVVSDANGQTMVMDMAQLGAMAQSFGADLGGGDTFKQELLKYSSKGKSETVAGYKGDVYTLTWQDNSGTHTADAVLSGHKDVREFFQAWQHMAEAMANSVGQKMTTNKSVMYFLEREGKGVLRLGEDFRVVSIEPGEPDASRFVLPAKPMQMPTMGGVGGYPTQASGSSNSQAQDTAQETSPWGSFFGQKAERQKDRQVNSAERAVDYQVDRAVDKALDGVLKGVFGR